MPRIVRNQKFDNLLGRVALDAKQKIDGLQAELDAAWKAAAVPVRGMVELAEVIADLRAKRDEYKRDLDHERAEHEGMRVENAGLQAKLKRQAVLEAEGWDEVPVVDIYELRVENAELKRQLDEVRQIADVEANIAATGRSNEW